MNDFNGFLVNIPVDVRDRGPKIKVAVIDDGVDFLDNDLIDKIVRGASFCQTGKQEDGESNYFVSSKGHGTAMAKLICRVFSYAELYVVKLDGAETGKPTAASAAEVGNLGPFMV